MSNTETDTEIKVPETQATLAGLPLFIFEDGIKDVDAAIKAIRDSGQNIFFLLADLKVKHEKESKDGKSKTVTYSHQPRLFKVVSNLVGNAISAIDTAEVGLETVEQMAYFTLPAIPWELVQSIDAFFRLVDDKHGTEAIVLFTFDPEYLDTDEPGNGWGVLVPEQKNSAGSCDYDPQSVIDDKPDEVYIVGSAHSHPGMAAFCSGTDKADQAEFDGIHITYGWKNNSSLTDYHIELQMGGASYLLDAKDAFADMPMPEVTDDVEKWTEKVSKKTFTNTSGGRTLGSGVHSSYYGSGYGNYSDPDYSKIPDDLPKPSDTNCVIAMPLLTLKEIKDCPVCQDSLSDYDKKSCKCLTCYSYFVPADIGTIDNLIIHREKSTPNSYNGDLNPDGKQKKNIWVWKEILEDGKMYDEVYLLSEGTAGKDEVGRIHGDRNFSRV